MTKITTTVEIPCYKWYYGKFIKIGILKTEVNDSKTKSKRTAK